MSNRLGAKRRFSLASAFRVLSVICLLLACVGLLRWTGKSSTVFFVVSSAGAALATFILLRPNRRWATKLRAAAAIISGGCILAVYIAFVHGALVSYYGGEPVERMGSGVALVFALVLLPTAVALFVILVYVWAWVAEERADSTVGPNEPLP